MDGLTEKPGADLKTLADNLLFRLRGMLSIEPIIGNLIAIAFAIGLLTLLKHPTLFPDWLSTKWSHYLNLVVSTGMVIQLLKSSSKSILLPLLTLALAGAGLYLQNSGLEIHFVATSVLQQLMLLGVVGMANSVFKIR